MLFAITGQLREHDGVEVFGDKFHWHAPKRIAKRRLQEVLTREEWADELPWKVRQQLGKRFGIEPIATEADRALAASLLDRQAVAKAAAKVGVGNVISYELDSALAQALPSSHARRPQRWDNASLREPARGGRKGDRQAAEREDLRASGPVLCCPADHRCRRGVVRDRVARGPAPRRRDPGALDPKKEQQRELVHAAASLLTSGVLRAEPDLPTADVGNALATVLEAGFVPARVVVDPSARLANAGRLVGPSR